MSNYLIKNLAVLTFSQKMKIKKYFKKNKNKIKMIFKKNPYFNIVKI